MTVHFRISLISVLKAHSNMMNCAKMSACLQRFKFACVIYFAVLLSMSHVHCTFKLTKAFCQSKNKNMVVVNHCRIRPLQRDINVFNMNVTFLRNASNIQVREHLLKKANGYKPFLFNITFDACQYVRRPNHPILNLIYKLFKEFSNINHTCPYVGDQIIEGFYLKIEGLNHLPLPNGDYVLCFTWILNKIPSLITDVYFELRL